jgi:pilus assembly protein CpaB
VTVVTLLVTPEQAERLTLASTEGKIQLALRNPLDAETPETPGVRPGILLGMNQPRPVIRRVAPASPGAPPPPAPPPPSVEIIRGDKRVHVVVG